MDASEISHLFGVKIELAEELRNSSHDSAEELESRLFAQGFRLSTQQDATYPQQLLKQLGDKAPPILYLQGVPEIFEKRGLAFSGSRHASEQGLKHTAELVEQAVRQGVSIISGHAPGVDSIAHRTALEQDGTTILVLPEGVLTFKLRPEIREWVERSPQHIGIVSEFPPHMPWSAPNAMIRNQTLIGLSEALCVIEAGDTGGTLSAGQTALKLKIPVLVLDYPNPPSSAAGNKLLLKQGAQPVSTVPKAVLPDWSTLSTPSYSDDKPTQLSLF